MGNCLTSMKQKEEKYKITLAVVGLENSGKTTVIKALKGDALSEVLPTVGFKSDVLDSPLAIVTIYDLGGSARIRDIWKSYLPEVWGLVYVVDAADHSKLIETRNVFHQLLDNPHVQKKPVLLLLNKQDNDGAIDEVEALEHLQLKTIVNKNQCPCRVEICTASKGTGRNCDAPIRAGFHWLVGQIDSTKSSIQEKVEKDMQIAKEMLKKDRIERADRVRKAKEEDEQANKIAPTDLNKEDSSDNIIHSMNTNAPDQSNTTIINNGRTKPLLFEPLPQIDEEGASQASATQSRQGSMKRNSSHIDEPRESKSPSQSSGHASSYDSKSLLTHLKQRRNSGELRVTSLGVDDSSKLPPISSANVLTLNHSYIKPVPPSTPPSYKQSTNDGSTVPEGTSRKRRRRRLQRLNKTSPGSQDSDESHANTPRTFIPPVSLDKLPSSGPNELPASSYKLQETLDNISPKYKPRLIPFEEPENSKLQLIDDQINI